MVLCSAMLTVMAQGTVSFANEQDDILNHNEGLLGEFEGDVKEGYGIKNNWLRLSY